MMKAILRVIATVLVVAAGSAGAYELWDYYMLSPWTRDAKVRADVVTIAPDVAGFVTDLRVKDNQFVHKGDILFVVDQARYRLALATAEANVAAGKASMLLAQGDARRRAKLTTLSITDEDKENSQHQADSATATYGQAVADRGHGPPQPRTNHGSGTRERVHHQPDAGCRTVCRRRDQADGIDRQRFLPRPGLLRRDEDARHQDGCPGRRSI